MVIKRNIILFQVFVVIVFVLLSNHLVFAAGDHAHEPVLQSASELDYPPFALVKPDGTADGFSVDLLKAVVDAAGLEVNISVGPWIEIKQQLADGHLDVLPLVGYTPDRDKVYDFTVPYLRLHGTIFIRRGEKNINGEEDLKGKEIVVMRGDNAHEYLVEKKLTDRLILTNSFEEAMRLLSSGKHDAVLCQYLVGLQLIKKLGIKNVVIISTKHAESLKLRASKVSGYEQKFCIAVPEGKKELLAHLNEGLAIVSADGTYNKLYEKWFSPILPDPPVPLAKIIKYVFITIISILFIFAVLGMWYLRREVHRKTRSLRKEIEERKLIEKQFQHSHELMHYVISHARSAIAVHDLDLNYVYVSDRYLKEYNVKEKNVIGKHHYDIFPDLPQKWRDVHQKALAGEISSAEEDPYFREDGSVEWTRWECRPWYGSNGTIDGIIIYTEVITKQIEDRLALQKSKEEWENTFDAIKDIVTIQDKDMRILKANKSAHQFFQVNPGDLNGKYCYEIFREANHPCSNCPEIATLDDGKIHSTNITHEKLGKMFHVTSSPILEENGEFTHIVHIAKDITEHKKMEAQLQQAQKMEAIGTLAGGIAHDFNNILSPILGYAEMVQDNLTKGSELWTHQQEVLKAADRAKELVKQILAFSRQSEHERKPLQVYLIVKEAIKLLRASIPTTIEIREDIDTKSGTALADPTQIHQILMNLCTNAYHAMRETGGILAVELAQIKIEKVDTKVTALHLAPGSYLLLKISDTGTGMDQATVDRIFDPYFTTKKKEEGTGMGLAVVHGIVKNHGGHITVYSEPGHGTSFQVYLPRIVTTSTESEAKLKDDIPLGNERILIIDDEETILRMEQQMLERLGYKVTAMVSCEEALHAFTSHPESFDLIITDMTMPHMTGAELSQKLLTISPDIPIIICTGFSELINEEKAKAIGIREYVMKPIVRNEIAKVVRKVLDETG